jgi:galactonate dehydratase
LKIADVKTFVTSMDPSIRTWVFVKVETDEGVHGWGEATLEHRELSVERAIHEMAADLIGEDPTRVEHHWQRLFRHRFWRGGVVLNSALAGIDQALWDIVGKVAGLPVYKLFGGPTRDRVRLYTHVGIYDSARMVDDAQRHVAEGYTAMKTGAWPGLTELGTNEMVRAFAGRVGQLRAAVGDGVDLMVDNHGRDRPSTAIRLMRALEPFGLYFFEEPCWPENVDGLAEVKAAGIGMDLAAGERAFSRWDARPLIERHLVDVLQPDLCHAGGITEVKKIAAMTEMHQIQLAPHNPQGPVSLAACVQIAASIPNFAIQEYVPSQPWRDRVLKEPWPVRDGHVALPTAAGLGVDLDEKVLRANPYRPRESRGGNYTRDGAVADI